MHDLTFTFIEHAAAFYYCHDEYGCLDDNACHKYEPDACVHINSYCKYERDKQDACIGLGQ